MKKRLMNFILCLSVLTLTPLLSSCYDDEDFLIGTWWTVDDPYNVICLNFGSNNVGTCTEYDEYGYVYSSDLFDWEARNRVIYIYFRTGIRGTWTWDYRRYNGNTVEINGRVFSRDRYYRYPAKKYEKNEKLTE